MTSIGSDNLTNGPGKPERFGGKYRGARRDTVLTEVVSTEAESAGRDSAVATEPATPPLTLPSLDPNPLTEPSFPASGWSTSGERLPCGPPTAAGPDDGVAAQGQRAAAGLAGPLVRGDPGDPGTAIRAGRRPGALRPPRAPAWPARRAGCDAARGVRRWPPTPSAPTVIAGPVTPGPRNWPAPLAAIRAGSRANPVTCNGSPISGWAAAARSPCGAGVRGVTASAPAPARSRRNRRTVQIATTSAGIVARASPLAARSARVAPAVARPATGRATVRPSPARVSASNQPVCRRSPRAWASRGNLSAR